MSPPQSELEQRALSRLGKVVCGKYRLDSLIGIGGMAAVYRATHRNQAELAIKILHTEISLYEDFRARFLKEGYAANSVKHPGVVLVVDDDVTEDGAAFLVMELLRGSSVDALLKVRGKLPAFEAMGVGLQLLDVLRVAHGKSIIHRDIKPANLFVTRDGTLKVLDFGIARARDEAAPEEQRTGTGVLLGTPAYMAPEQANAKASEIDARTDLWSVGATLFTLLTGKAVHESDNAARALINAASQPARKLGDVEPSLPPAIAEAIDRALEFARDKRWADASSMRRALSDACKVAFGTTPARSTLAALVAEPGDSSSAATRPGKEPAPPAGAAGQPPEPELGATIAAPPPEPVHRATPAALVQAARADAVPPAAANPPSAGDATRDAVTLGGRHSGRLGLIVAIGLVACGVFLLLGALRSRSRASAGGEAPPPEVTSASPAPPPQGTATATATEPQPPVSAPSPANPFAAAPLPSEPPSAAPPAEPVPETRPNATRAPAGEPQAVPGAAPAETQRASAPRKPSRKADCNPNYTLDKDGNKHFKPECF